MRVILFTTGFLFFFSVSFPVIAQGSNEFNRAKQLYEAGNQSLAASDYTLAIDRYTEAIALYPSVPEFYFNRAIAHRDIRRFDLAIKDFEKVIALKPTLPAQAWIELYLGLGTVYQENTDYSKAIEILTKTLQLA